VRREPVDLDVDRGTTIKNTVTWSTKDPDTGIVSEVDLTGCTVAFRLKSTLDAATSYAEVTTTAGATGSIVLTPLEGKMDVTVTDETTAALTASKGKWELVISFPDGSKKRLLHGAWKVVS
jgi:hypothetical protein